MAFLSPAPTHLFWPLQYPWSPMGVPLETPGQRKKKLKAASCDHFVFYSRLLFLFLFSLFSFCLHLLISFSFFLFVLLRLSSPSTHAVVSKFSPNEVSIVLASPLFLILSTCSWAELRVLIPSHSFRIQPFHEFDLPPLLPPLLLSCTSQTPVPDLLLIFNLGRRQPRSDAHIQVTKEA